MELGSWNSTVQSLLRTHVHLLARTQMDSLRFSSAISFSLAVLFLIGVIGVTIYKLIMGSIETPTLFPSVTDLASFCDIFTAVPVVAFCLCLPLQCSHN
ncbi:hypothetical protein ACJW31_01G217300 [Castanea mollissima]